MRRRIAAAVLALALSLSACSAAKDPVSVQRADQLVAAGQAQERYAGMVVSENIVKIQKDGSKTILETYVTTGQKVSEGDKLFSYDTDALQIDLEKLQLEVDKMKNEQATYTEQVDDLQDELDNTWSDSEIVRLTLEINTLKTKLMEIDYQLKAKTKEIDKLKDMLENADVTSPVDGTIRKIDEQGESGAYITIQQMGAFQVKGQLNEMSMANGMMAGTRVKVISRINPDQFWMGTVSKIDMDGGSTEENGGNMMGGMNSNPMTSSSDYPFYVELDNIDGLLLGQHVYMEIAQDDNYMEGLWIPSLYVTDLAVDEQTGNQTGHVLAANAQNKLEQKTVQLGMLDEMSGCYEVLSGLNPDDYLADPTAAGSKVGAPAERRAPEDFGGNTAEPETVPAETELPEELPETSEETTESLVTETDPTAETPAEQTEQPEG